MYMYVSFDIFIIFKCIHIHIHIYFGFICVIIPFRLITSDFAAAAVLITFGAVLGKVSRLQLMIIGVLEIIFYALNEKILSHKLHVTDVGGSMVIHAFGAYFGLAVARVISNEDIEEENEKEGSSYNSDLFAMIGRLM